MNKELLKILSNSNKDIDNQKLMDYLAGKLPEDQKNEVEQWMADSDFSDDALEGLQQFKQPKDIQSYVEELHNNLNKQLQKKKNHVEKKTKTQRLPLALPCYFHYSGDCNNCVCSGEEVGVGGVERVEEVWKWRELRKCGSGES